MKVTVLGRQEMEDEGMGSFLGVAQGTPQDPKLIALEYTAERRGKPVVLVGKGLCFDSGGISIKPAQSMELMKFDMCGAAGVLGAMEAIGRLEARGQRRRTRRRDDQHAVGNGGQSGRCASRATSGKYIEIINTDAEGRLVLCRCAVVRAAVRAGRR